jgi:hypothetical protein
MVSEGKRHIRISLPEVLLLVISLALAGFGASLLRSGRQSSSSTEVLEQRLRDLRQLKTVSQLYRSVIFIDEKKFLLGTKQVLFALEYEVTAGVDFSRGIELRRMPDETVSVQMPPAEILSSDAYETSIREMILREQPFFNPVRMGDYIPQVIAQGEANRASAVKSGILSLAEANARIAVSRVLQLAGVQNVIFESSPASGASDG